MSDIDDTAVNEVVESTAQDSPIEETSKDDFDKSFDVLDEVETESNDDSEAEEQSDAKTDDNAGETPSQVNPKSENRFQKLANENRELNRQIAELQAKQAQFANEQDLLNEINPDTGDYYTPQEVERMSWQQQREAMAERTKQEIQQLQIQQTQQAISGEAQEVVNQFPLLNPDSKEFNQDIATKFDDLLADNLIFALPDGRTATGSILKANGIDPSTQTLVGANISPYKLAKTISDAYMGARSQGEVLGQANAQRAAERMASNADPSSNASQASRGSEEKDFIESFFD